MRGENWANKEYYFRDLGWAYDHQRELGHPDHYDKTHMDLDFGHLLGVCSTPGELRSVARMTELEAVLKAVFHFDEGFEWRLPGPDGRIYHRPGDGFVGVFLEHLRAEYRPKSHHILKALCKDEFQLPIQSSFPTLYVG